MKSFNELKGVDLFLQIFYLFKLLFLSWSFQLYAPYFTEELHHEVILAKLFGGIIIGTPGLYTLAMVNFALLIGIIVKPRGRGLKILEAFLAALLVANLTSARALGHSLNNLILISFILSFAQKKNFREILFLAIGLHLSTYVCSGLWKIYSIAEAIYHNVPRAPFSDYLLLIMTKISIRLGTNNILLDLLFKTPAWLRSLMMIGVIAFQVGLIVPILKRKFSPLLGLLIVLFHLGNQLLLDINFIEAQALSILLFFLGLPLSSLEDKEEEQIKEI